MTIFETNVDRNLPSKGPGEFIIMSTASTMDSDGIAGIKIWALGRDLPLGQAQCPEAFPSLAGDSADAIAIIAAYLGLVVGRKHLIGEGQEVSGAIALFT